MFLKHWNQITISGIQNASHDCFRIQARHAIPFIRVVFNYGYLVNKFSMRKNV